MFEQPFLHSARMNYSLGNMACGRKKECGSKLYFLEIDGMLWYKVTHQSSHTYPPWLEELFYCTLLSLCVTDLCLLYSCNLWMHLIKYNEIKIQFMISMKLLHVLTPEDHPQGVCLNNGKEVQHANLGTDYSQLVSLTLCSRATTKVVFSVTRFDPQSQLSLFSHAPFCECICRQV
jgi:hypothetical protein